MQKQHHLAWGALLGLLTGLAVIALSYLAEEWAALPFFPFVLFDWLARVLPGGVITLAIDSMVRVIVALGLGPIAAVAKTIEQILGMLLWLAASAVIGIIVATWIRRQFEPSRGETGSGRQAGAIAGLCLAALVVGAMAGLRQFGPSPSWTLLWLAFLVPSWGAVLGAMLERLAYIPVSVPTAAAPGGAGAPAMGRRAFLVRVGGGSVLAAALAAGLGALAAEDKSRTGAARPLGEAQAQAAAPAANPTVPAAPESPPVVFPPTPAGRAAPAPGTRPEVTSTSDFYRVDIDLLSPSIPGASWQLEVTGLFDHPRNLTLQDLLAMPAVTQPITQSCISNPIGGDLIGTVYYTGVRLKDVLEELGVQPTAKQIALQAADGFYESVSTEDMRDPRVLLVYGLNGETLPIEHGYPLRIYIPNRYGMKQPKWIIGIQALDHEISGYWVERGWSAEARPQVISIIDTVAQDRAVEGRVPVGGIAWAGDRGIRSVEVQVDEGAWEPAELITPPLGSLTWVQWRYDWPLTPGRHTFRVRATDGKGAAQNGDFQDTYPDGATGYHSVSATF